MLSAAALLLAFSPVNHAARAKKVVHGGHFTTVATNSQTYYVEFSFNLSNNHFGYFHISPDSDHGTYVDGTFISGSADSPDGSVLEVTSMVTVEFNGGNDALYMPVTYPYNQPIDFDW